MKHANLNCFGAMLLVGLTFLSATAQALPEVSRGELLLQSVGDQYLPAPLLATSVDVKVSGVVARVTLQQRFRNDTESWVEAVYAFPLPEDAAVNRMRMVIGARVITGVIAEREEAQRRYQKARDEGKKASLVQQQRPNLFRNHVANIGPGEEILVELEYTQQVQWQGQGYSLRFPMTITPRYVPAGVSDAKGVAQAAVLEAQLPTPESHQLRVSASIDMGTPLVKVGSRYHPLALTRSGHQYQLTLAEDHAALDRDLVLEWQPRLVNEPEPLLLTGQHVGEDYALLMLLPPKSASLLTQPREMIFVIDTSGSMGGSSIEQARSALQFALTNLAQPHTFNIIEFNSSARRLFAQAQPATPHNLARASEFVRHLSAGGGTEMLPALELALPQTESERLRQVIFMTDGAVTNETALFKFISARLAASRFFTVGIGSSPNGWFMRKAAQFGRGSFTYIGDSREVESRLESLFAQLSSPQLTDIQVQWPQGVEAYPQRLPDLYAGEPVQLLVRFDQPLRDGVVVISGTGGSGAWQRQLRLSPAGDAGAVASLWARQKIAALLDRGVLGVEAAVVRSLVLPVALEHQLLSPYTSFVAVEEVVSRPAEMQLGSRGVPNLVPHGHQSPLAWPATALGIERRLATGSMLLSLLVIIMLLQRRWRAASSVRC